MALTATVYHVDLGRGSQSRQCRGFFPAEMRSASAGPYCRLAGCDPVTRYPTRAKLVDLGPGWLAEAAPA